MLFCAFVSANLLNSGYIVNEKSFAPVIKKYNRTMNNNIYDKIKSKLDIIDVINKYVPVTKKSSGGIALCPFHNDSKPSLSISNKLQIFKCFVCDAKGDCISFVAQYEKIPYFQAAKKLIEDFDLGSDLLNEANQNSNFNMEHEREYFLNEKTGLFFHNFLYNQENSFALDYLKSRQIDDQLIKHFNLGFAPIDDQIMVEMLLTPEFVQFPYGEQKNVTYKDLSDIGIANLDSKGKYHCCFYNRIMIPIYDRNNHLIAFSGRSLDSKINPKYLNTQTTNIFNKDSVLYNYQNVLKLTDYSSVYLVEGYMDVFGLYRGEIENVIATMGVALTESHIKILQTNHKIQTVILAYDNDDAGREATLKAGRLLGKRFNVLVVAPYGNLAKDFDELYCKYGKEKVIERANRLADFVSYAITILGTRSRSEYVKMNDFLTQAFELIASCGQEINYGNYFQKIKDMCDKSEAFKDKYSLEDIQKGYVAYMQNQAPVAPKNYGYYQETEAVELDDYQVNNRAPTVSKQIQRNYKNNKNANRYSFQNVGLSQKEYNRKYPPKKKNYQIKNDLLVNAQTQTNNSSSIDSQKQIYLKKIHELEQTLLVSFYQNKQALEAFEKSNQEYRCCFLNNLNQQLYKLIKQWYINNPSRGSMIYDQIDLNQFCCQDENLIKTFQTLIELAKTNEIKDPHVWHLISYDWLYIRYKINELQLIDTITVEDTSQQYKQLQTIIMKIQKERNSN